MLVVYFSSVSENTARFVNKLHRRAVRIGVKDDVLEVDEPYILLTPTYGSGRGTRMLPLQVSTFLKRGNNSSFIKGVIASGNTNFNSDYARAGDVISAFYNVPYLYRFEIFGSPVDVTHVQEIVDTFTG